MENKYALMKMPVEEIGRALACSDDEVQATLLNTFAFELRLICRDDDMQTCHIAGKLDANGKQLVRNLHEYMELREKAEADAKGI